MSRRILFNMDYRQPYFDIIIDEEINIDGKIMVKPFNEDFLHENKCKYVSSYGLLKSCDIKSDTPISSIGVLINYDFNN